MARKPVLSWTNLLPTLIVVVVVLSCVPVADGAQAAPALQTCSVGVSTPLQVQRLDPTLDRIIPAGARLECLVTGFTWLEGPVWAGDRLFFADIAGNAIRSWSPTAGVSVFLHPSGYLGPASYTGPESGSNGMTLDARGRLTVAGHAQRDVYRFDSLRPSAPITLLADAYQGRRLNSPNDLVYRSDGSLYFTDPPYGLPTQQDTDPAKQLTVNGVYRIPRALQQPSGATPDRAHLQLVIADLPRPNGIAFSPDEKFLYVDSSQPRKIWMRYRVQPDGSLTEPRLLYDATSDTRPGNPDGMKVDRQGNIYSAGPGGVWIFSPEGKPLGVILIPNRTSNLTWGGPDRRTLYITATGNIYRVRLNIPGAALIRTP